MEAINNFKNLKEEFEQKKKSMFAELKAEFSKQAKSYFDKYPEVNSIGVPAYTMGFNDGEPCYWSLYNETEMIMINDQNLDEEFDDRENCPKYGTPEYEALYSSLEPKYKDASDFFGAFPTDFYEDVFEEGAITVHRDGRVTVEEYYHD